MPRVAILADIHGNLPALRAVLDDLERQRPDEVLVGGDLVGRGPQGSRVIEVVRERGWRTVRGNHEDYLLAFRRNEVPADWQRAKVWSAARWMAAELADGDAEYLAALPDDLRSRSLPDVRLVHGSPRSNDEGIGPWTSRGSIRRHLDSISESVLVCAHTHRPLEKKLSQGHLINVGSVGLPFNRDPRAQYVVLHGRGSDVEAEFRQVAYDRAEIYGVYERTGFLEAGGVTARLLFLELRDAAPYLVPFLSWTAARGRPPESESIPAFLEEYHPDRQREFFRDLAGPPRKTPALG